LWRAWEALANGVQVKVTPQAKEAGISFPVLLTRAVRDNYVTVRQGRPPFRSVLFGKNL
jgi:hypothetical protein